MSLRTSVAFFCLTLLVVIEDVKSSSCAFYCFVVPSRKDTFDIAPFHNLSCTHFVYGFSRIRPDMSLRSITSRDNLEIMSPGNLRKFLGLRNTHPHATLLLGVQMTANDVFQDVRHARRTAELITYSAMKRHFDGVFLRMEGPPLESTTSQHFLSALSLTQSGASSQTTLAISPRWMLRVINRLYEFADYVEHIYLDMEELPSSEDPYSVRHVDPLMPSDSIPLEDTISGSVDKMLSSGVPAEKIVVGLTSGGRSYRVRNPRTTTHGDIAMQEGVRRRLQDICLLTRTSLDAKAACTVIEGRFSWTSANFPKEQSLGKKIQWFTQEGLGGVGISSLQDDDPKGKCGAGSYPSHTMIGKMLKCRVREYQRRPPIQCTRLCYLNEGAEEFDPNLLLPHWCSHFIVGPADIQLNDNVEVPPAVPKLMARINQWMQDSEGKPAKIILSIGERQSNDIWRMELGSIIKRKHLINNIKNLVHSLDVSGVEISWTLGQLDAVLDPTFLSQFLADLRTVLPKNIHIFLSVNPLSSFSGRYDIDVIANVTNLIILQTHRLQSSRATLTEHHSPMFPSVGLQDTRMTVESFVKDMISRGVPRKKIIVSVTSAPTSTTLKDKWDGSGEVFGRPIDSLASSTLLNRITSQTEICRALENNNTVFRWVEGSGIPILVRGNEFVAYDNEKSAKIKTTWSSLNNLGGMAVHGLPLDNPNGECPERPFPILQSIVDAQVCSLCAPKADKSNCSSSSFQTVCNYRLPEPDEAQRLAPANIPFERCSGVVVEHAMIDANSSIHFVSKKQEQVVKELKKFRSRAKSFVISLRCSMQEKEFAQLMQSAPKRLKLATSIRSFVDGLSFNGVELRCADLLSKTTKIQFAHFLRILNKEMKAKKSDGCGNTVSLRLSAWQSDLRSIYDIVVLNSLNQIVLEPFTVPLLPDTAFVHSPLFPISNHSSITSIDVIVRRWESSGLDRSKILLQIPSYGMEQLLVNRSDVGIGRPTEKEYAVIGQAELCQRLKYAGTVRETHWDSMSVNAWTTGGRWISIDDQQTVKYKMRYALREGLAGVGLMSLNEDDHMGTCGSGAFPILRSIAAKCH
uniref:Glycoside hydrolase domain containing protein n=1 Tax=Haemonchus contortus TaxID=6289 RepID=A0A7I4YLU1_HAECO